MGNRSFAETYLVDGARIILQIFLAPALIVFLVHSILAITFPYPLDYGEGPLLNQVLRLAAGENIYQPSISTPPYTVSNYPPLYVLVVMPLVSLFGPAWWMGRLISLAATILSALFLALIVQSFSRDRLAAVVTGILFLITPFVVKWSGLMRVDMLALALSTGGLYLLVRSPGSLWSRLASGLLLVAAIYTRQSYALAAPLAAFIWLWTQNRRHAVQMAVGIAGLSFILFLVLNVLTDGGFFFNLVTANLNEFDIERLGEWLVEVARIAPVASLLGLGFILLRPGSPHHWALPASYLVGAFLATLTIGKAGSNANYLLELSAAFSLVIGSVVYHSRQHPWRLAAVFVLIALQTGLFMQATLDDPVAGLVFRRGDSGALEQLDQIIADSDSPILADEYMGLIAAQNRPLYMQPFEVTQLSEAGEWDQSDLLESIEEQAFPLILIYHSPFGQLHEERWTPQMLATIDEIYRPSQTLAGNVVYRPTSVTGIATTFAPAEQPTFSPEALELGSPVRISGAAFVFEPTIQANPVNPDHLAAIVMSASDLVCDPPDCAINLLLLTSTDGGSTWQEQTPFSGGRSGLRDGMVRFGPDGTLYAIGVRGGQPILNKSDATAGYDMAEEAMEQIRTASNPSRPWLTLDPENEALYLSYAGRSRGNVSVRLNESTDQGETWSTSYEVDPGVPQADIDAGRAIPARDVQVLPGVGQNVAVAWRWQPGSGRWPMDVWLATSSDGGESFLEPSRIAQTWAPISTAFRNGTYYVLYRAGTAEEQRLALAISRDGGENWEAWVVNGDLRLGPDFDKAAAIGVAPDGTVDIMFYAYEEEEMDCISDELEQLQGFGQPSIDSCTYRVLYSFSEDGGESFSDPIQLNDEPIRGERFVRLAGRSVAFQHITIASTDAAAYPIWIATQDDVGTQAMIRRITR